MLLFDPSFIFLVPTLLIPLFANGDATTKTLTFMIPTPEQGLAYLNNKAIIAAFAFYVLAQLFTLGSGRSTKTANWFLLNGAIIHVAMDGLTGGYHAIPLMDASYRQLDNRFNEDRKTGASEDAWAAAYLVVTLELFVMAPMCFVTYFACMKKKSWRQEMVLLTGFIQLLGTIMFVFPEFVTGCKNLSPFGLEGCIERFTSVPSGSTLEYHGLFFLFAVGANLVWIFVPLKLMVNAWNENLAAKTGTFKSTTKTKAKIY
ncbi:hypothetical protein ScalyP_jg9061 [Parmales sp. scaly parma]|jgi:hypothetical protein|nr:hypothetical protein ScalyP_jg9061 [Parmales sp. scaly parma]|tara:strand:- start:1131 stop:1907 length:777 start_codon:yes stop_codon:yes gene_type:complete